eukprot:TRINITY_DN4059_c0_g2_i1.p1 TRINITY_DN4059_c0_g2~~TRINITY_DN4059_c0_g2_i1.p1  ORF type:complete len:491 (+),score=64.78 TRINITY_DN4059_c0_g2_i1:26-1474(+)
MNLLHIQFRHQHLHKQNSVFTVQNQVSPKRTNQFHRHAQLQSQQQQHQHIQQHQQNHFYGRVVFPTALSLLLCNMDRICLSVAILPMSQQFQWTESVQGLIQSAFLWGYLATQMIGGVLADKYGGKRVLAAGIVWFSAASVLLPFATLASTQYLLGAVLLGRFLVGFGEGVVMPSMTNLVSTYVKPELRASAFGNIFTGFHGGNLVGLVASPFIIEQFGWQALFYIFGVIGLPVLIIWNSIVPDSSRAVAAQTDKKSEVVNSKIQTGETQSDTSNDKKMVGIGRLLRTPPCWAIFVSHFTNNWGYFILLGWMPTYFSKQLGFNLRDSSLSSLLPWLVMAIGSTVMGTLADKLLQMGYSLRKVRVGIQSVSYVGMAASIFMMANESIGKSTAIALLMIILGFKSMGNAGFLANMSDIAPKNAGELFGLSNTFGSMAGILGVGLVGWLVEKTGSFKSVFLVTGGIYIFSLIVWMTLCRTEQFFY